MGAAWINLVQLVVLLLAFVITVPLALAGVGAGYLTGFDVVKDWQEIVETQEPNPDVGDLYGRYYRLYRDIYEQLKEQFKELVEIAKPKA